MRFFTGKFWLTYREKRGKGEKKGKRENRGQKKENCKNRWGKKYENGQRIFFFFFFFFFFCFSLFETTEICFGSTKMEIFYRENAFHASGKKLGKVTVPSEKYSSYATGEGLPDGISQGIYFKPQYTRY